MREGGTSTLRVLDDRYELTGRVGSGGMGSVFRAHDRRLDRTVAVKLLRTGGDEVHRVRLQAEARFAGGLQHPGIVRVYDYGEERGPDGEVTPYVVMQLVEGEPLSARLRRAGPLPATEVAALLAGLGEALAVAHGSGVVHRDLKPSNIVVTPRGEPVLVDFGVARSDTAEPLTETGSIIGTVDYLSPEQVEGQRATPASDVYALGVVAHQCLTGTSPFHRESQVATALAHLRDEVGALPNGLPAGLRMLVLDMIRRDPAVRPTALEVAARAATAVSAPAMVLPPPPTEPVRSPLAGVVPVPPALARLPHPTRARFTGRAALVVALALVVVAIGIGMAVAGRHPAAPSAAAAGDQRAPTSSARRHHAPPSATRTVVPATATTGTSATTRTTTAGSTTRSTSTPGTAHHAGHTKAPRHHHAKRHTASHGRGHGRHGHSHGHGHGRH